MNGRLWYNKPSIKIVISINFKHSWRWKSRGLSYILLQSPMHTICLLAALNITSLRLFTCTSHIKTLYPLLHIRITCLKDFVVQDLYSSTVQCSTHPNFLPRKNNFTILQNQFAWQNCVLHLVKLSKTCCFPTW